MTDAVEVIREEPETETAPVETQLPTDVAAPQTTDDRSLDDLLAEFDAATSKPEPEPVADNLGTQPDGNQSDLDQQIADLIGPDPKVAELQGRLGQLQAQMRLAEETKAFNDFSDDLTKRVAEINPHVDGEWTRLKLESYAHDAELRLAWDARNIDPKAAATDLAYVTNAWAQLKADPNADPKRLQELSRLAYQLDIAMRSPSILRAARNQIMSEAKKKLPPIDEFATADHDAVAFAVREAQSGDIPEPPVQWGRLSGREFRERVQKEFGFDPGTGW